VRHRRHGPAAELAERLGQRERAIEPTSARTAISTRPACWSAGRDREAVRLLERALELALADERAALRAARWASS
jgi:hypothetical protein